MVLAGIPVRSRGAPSLAVASALASVLAFVAAACGRDDDSPGPVDGNGVDRAFVSEMIPHHRSALKLAGLARRRTGRTEIQRLAGATIATQRAELVNLRRIARQLAAAGIRPRPLGLPAHEMGGDPDTRRLRRRRPFDRAYIDATIRHDQAAIRMARAVITDGRNPDIRDVAAAIIDAKASEIRRLNAWRDRWYGAPSPAGGVEEAKSDHLRR